MLGHGLSNLERGHTIKTILAATGHRLVKESKEEGAGILRTLTDNGFSEVARDTLISNGFSSRKKSGGMLPMPRYLQQAWTR